jgi:hypothetical protein
MAVLGRNHGSDAGTIPGANKSLLLVFGHFAVRRMPVWGPDFSFLIRSSVDLRPVYEISIWRTSHFRQYGNYF